MADAKNDSKQDSSKVNVSSVEKTINEEQEKGYRGTATDPTPRENYTVAGVTSGAPTPETDAKAAEAARKAVSGKE